jgi:hypothetical protein
MGSNVSVSSRASLSGSSTIIASERGKLAGGRRAEAVGAQNGICGNEEPAEFPRRAMS